MATQVMFHRLAAREARAAEQWYSERSLLTARRFRAAVLTAADKIATGAIVHRIDPTKFSYVHVAGFPYRLIFCWDNPTFARVVAVAHNRRRPGYWRRRT